MQQITIQLNTINDVKELVTITSVADFEVDLISGRYAVDAKSIIGIFSLDMSSPIKMNIYSDDCDDFIAALQKFVVG